MIDAFPSLLAQATPGNTSAATLYTATSLTMITRLVVCNTGAGACTFRVFHDNDGTTYDDTTALYYDVSVAAGAVYVIEALSEYSGIAMNASRSPGVSAGTIGIRSNTADDLTFTLYGIVQQAR